MKDSASREMEYSRMPTELNHPPKDDGKVDIWEEKLG